MLDLNPFFGEPAGISHNGSAIGTGEGSVIDTPFYRKK